MTRNPSREDFTRYTEQVPPGGRDVPRSKDKGYGDFAIRTLRSSCVSTIQIETWRQTERKRNISNLTRFDKEMPQIVVYSVVQNETHTPYMSHDKHCASKYHRPRLLYMAFHTPNRRHIHPASSSTVLKSTHTTNCGLFCGELHGIPEFEDLGQQTTNGPIPALHLHSCYPACSLEVHATTAHCDCDGVPADVLTCLIAPELSFHIFSLKVASTNEVARLACSSKVNHAIGMRFPSKNKDTR